jgi:hypothetical protein
MSMNSKGQFVSILSRMNPDKIKFYNNLIITCVNKLADTTWNIPVFCLCKSICENLSSGMGSGFDESIFEDIHVMEDNQFNRSYIFVEKNVPVSQMLQELQDGHIALVLGKLVEEWPSLRFLLPACTIATSREVEVIGSLLLIFHSLVIHHR